MIGAVSGPPISITGLGCYVPERVLSNDELATIVDTSDEWIRERTGIRERRIAAPEEALTDLALPAVHAALGQAQVEAEDIDLLVCATVTPDMMFPTASALLADTIGAPQAAAYDLLAGCTGFVYAIAQAYAMMSAGLSERALVVGGDVLSRILDWTDRSTLVLFGDGAGAVVVAGGELDLGVGGFVLGADGAQADLHYAERDEQVLRMQGADVYRHAVRRMTAATREALERAGKTVDDIDLFVAHQANVRIIGAAAAELGIPRDKVMVNVDRVANTSSASIPLALEQAEREGRLQPGDTVALSAFGAGFVWGAGVIGWKEREYPCA
jgi:3-oxoacyl-[acyl-carrier-protein] synthase-3